MHLSRLIPSSMRLTFMVSRLPTACLVVVLLGTTAHSQSPAVMVPSGAAASRPQQLARGVTYRQIDDTRGPWRMHVVQVDLRRAAVAFHAMRANDSLRGRERTSQMVQRATAAGAQVLAAINADFFDVRTGENENNQVLDGEWWKGLKVTDSPYDSYDNVHVQFAIDQAGRPHIDRYLLDGMAWTRDRMLPVLAVNAKLSAALEGTTLYTPRFGATTPRDVTGDSARVVAEAPLASAGRRGDTLLYVRRGVVLATAGTPIPREGAVLAAHGARAAAVQAMREGDTVRVLLTTVPRVADRLPPRLVVGGWPRVLQDGVNVTHDAATIEGTISRNAEARHPRTAIGYDKKRRTLWLVAVDGRTTASVGMTLVELADAMRRLGAWQAMNFDGGGSTTMLIDGRLVNTPTDATGERAVGNALLLVRRPSAR